MRIVQVIDTLDLLGGAQKMQVTLAEAVRNLDVHMTVVVLEDRSVGTILPKKLEALDVDVHHFPARSMLGPRRLWRLYRFLRNGRFDVAHTNLTHANIVGVLAARMAGIPTVGGLRNAFYERRRFHAFRTTLETFTLNVMANKVMAVGQATADAHQSRIPRKEIVAIPNSIVIPDSISDEKRTALRTELLDDPKRPFIITVGRLNAQKGYGDLLDAFATVQHTFPDARLLIVGGGRLFNSLQAQIESLNLSDTAFLLGRRENVPTLLAAADMFVSSSHWEGLSNAILEAMAAGLPIVATAVADTPNVVVPGTGLLVPPKQPETLAQAICTLLANPAQRQLFGQQAREHVATEHNPTKWAAQMLALYRSLLPDDKAKKTTQFIVENSKSNL